MRTKFLIIFLVLCFNFCFGQLDSFTNQATKLVVYLSGKAIKTEKLNANTEVEIYYRDPKSSQIKPLFTEGAGTGFFVSFENVLYLVTAEHVAKSILIDTKVTFNDSSNTAFTLSLNQIQDSSLINWTFHKSADVAVLPIDPESILYTHRNFIAFPLELTLTKLESPGRYKDALAFGFPLRLGVQKYFSPISMSSKVASDLIDLKRFDKESISSFILLDGPSVPGLSGGPVFVVPSFFDNREEPNIFGLMHGVISDNTGGKFAAVVPSRFIMETIIAAKKFNGVKKTFYPNGKVWQERLYRNSQLIEIISNYAPNGSPQDKGTLKNGNGTVKYYDETGKLLLINYYENKKLIKSERVSQ